MSYSVQVTIYSQGATYAETVESGDPGDYGLADPLTITQKLASNDRLPLSHPLPEEATVNLIAPDGATYAKLALGDQVAIKLYTQSGFAGTPIAFYGRIASLDSVPHERGVLFTLGCLDYTADLAELEVGGAADYPLEQAHERIQRICDELGMPGMPRVPAGWVFVTSPELAIRGASNTDAYSLIVQTLDSWYQNTFKDENWASLAGAPHTFSVRPCLYPNIVADRLSTNTPFQLRAGVPWTRRVSYAPPLRLDMVAGKLTVTADAADSSPATGTPIIDGSRVKFGPRFTQQKGGGLPNVTIGEDAQGNRYRWDWRNATDWAAGGATFGPGGLTPYESANTPVGPPIVQSLDSILDVTDAGAGPSPASFVQAFRVPFPPTVAPSWQVGTLSWQAWAEPAPWRRPELTELLTVSDADTPHMPNVREWVSGLVIGTVVTVSGGRPTVDIDLAPPSYDYDLNRWALGASNGVVSFDSPVLAGVTLAQLNPRDTFQDYQLVRGS